MDSAGDISSEHLHAKADEYEAAAKRYRAAAVALEDPEAGQPKPMWEARRRAQSTNGTVTRTRSSSI
jgi:hypothetical protein